MKNLKIEPKSNMPRIEIDFQSGIIGISGRSYPEFPEDFYKMIISEINENMKTNSVSIIFDFDYVNTSSSKCILELIKSIRNNFQLTNIEWSFEEDDEDMEDLGKDLSDSVGIEFQYKMVV